MLKEIFALTKASFIFNGDLTPRVLPSEQVSNFYVPWSYDYKVTKLGDINKRPMIADLSYFYGSKQHLSKEIANNAIAEMTHIFFSKHILEKMLVSTCARVASSIREPEKNYYFLSYVKNLILFLIIIGLTLSPMLEKHKEWRRSVYNG